MDYQSLRSVFAQTISPEIAKRREAEVALETLETRQDFILSLPSTFMVDADPTVKKVSTIFFKNSVLKNWSSTGFKGHIMGNIVGQMVGADKTVLTSYKEILRSIFQKEEACSLGCILEKVPGHICSENTKENYVAVLILLLIQDNDSLRYNKEVVYPLLEQIGGVLVDKLLVYLKQRNYLMARLVMKLVSKVSRQYSAPVFFAGFDAYVMLFQTSRDILEIRDCSDEVLRLKKWALRYIHRATQKGFKKFHKDQRISSIVTQEEVVVGIVNLCKGIIHEHSTLQMEYEKTASGALEYISLLIEEKEFLQLVMDDASFYLNTLVVKTHAFTEKVEMDFETFPENYLRQKYNMYSDDLRTHAGAFFRSLVKKMKKYPSLFDGVLEYLTSMIVSVRQHPGTESARICYASLSLLSLISHHITNVKKGETGDFLIDYVFPLLDSEHVFLQTQACYLLQFFDGSMVSGEATLPILERVCGFIESENDIVRVDAAHAITFFFSSEAVQKRFVVFVPHIIRTIIDLNNKYNLESLSDVLESVVNSYPDEVSRFAPRLTESLTVLVARHLSNYDDSKLMLVAGYMRTMEGMVSSVRDLKTLQEMFRYSFDLLLFVFRERKSDFYQESIDMVVSYLYNMKSVDDPMWVVFKAILGIERNELSNNVDEVTNLIDNYISFGGERILQQENYGLVMNFVEKMCLASSEDFFDDDHNCGCKIMESLLLNDGQFLGDRLDLFMGYAIHSRALFEDGSSSWVYTLNVVMHCFVLNPGGAMQALQSKGFCEEFFDRLHSDVNMFGRVHDKKTIILFLGVLCGQPELELDYTKLAKVLAVTLKTLPDAINKRNSAKKNAEKTPDVQSSEEYDSFSDYEDDMLDEDIYFETVLDGFDPFPYISKILGSTVPSTAGSRLIAALSSSQKTAIQKILSSEQPKQT